VSVFGFEIVRELALIGGFVGDKGIEVHRLVPLTAMAVSGDAVFSVSDDELPENVAGATLAVVKRRTTRVPNYILCENPRRVALGIIARLLNPDKTSPSFESCRVGGASVAFERLPNGAIVHLHQLGGVKLGRNVLIGAYTTIDRGTLNTVNTEIGDDVVIGSHVHIAHNVKIGARAAIMDHACICGSAEIGEDAWIGPRVVVRDHIKIGARAAIAIGSVVLEDIPAGSKVIGYTPLKGY
jgi:hypothetical protein